MRSAFRSSLLCVFVFFCVFFCAGHASAISLTMAGANGQFVAPGDQVTITVTLDTEGQAGIVLLSTGVLFDDTILSYNAGASSASSYVLYGIAGKGVRPSMKPAVGSYPNYSPEMRFGTTNQVNVDFVSDLGTGANPYGSTWSGGVEVSPQGTVAQLAVLVFDVIDFGDGVADIGLSITSPGNIIQLAGGIDTTATLYGAGTVITPEPTTALLLGLGLAGLAARRRV